MADKVYDTIFTLIREQYLNKRAYRLVLEACNDYYPYRVKVDGGWKFFQFENDYITWKSKDRKE